MCQKCDFHLIKDHLEPLLFKIITTKKNLKLKVVNINPMGHGAVTLRKMDTGREVKIIIWNGADESISRAHSYLHHGGIIEGIHVPNGTSIWSRRFSKVNSGYLYAILKEFPDVLSDKGDVLKATR